MDIPDPDLDFLHIPDPGFRGQKGNGSRISNNVNYGTVCVLREGVLTPKNIS
jgi:hypothetical protein